MAALLCIYSIACCCQLGSKTLIARCLLYSPATSCLWYSIIILCILQRRRENASLLPLLFHQDLFYFCSVSFISFHCPAVCLYSHIKVTFATLFPPKPPTLPFSLETRERERERSGGLTTHSFHTAIQYLTCWAVFNVQWKYNCTSLQMLQLIFFMPHLCCLA